MPYQSERNAGGGKNATNPDAARNGPLLIPQTTKDDFGGTRNFWKNQSIKPPSSAAADIRASAQSK